MKKDNKYPEWVNQYRTPGHSIKKVRDSYYLYETTSKRVMGKDYPVTSSKYIGKITEKGLEKGEHKIVKVDELQQHRSSLLPQTKVKVFISSNMNVDEGTPKYKLLRQNIKKLLEDTGMFDAYVFELEGASTRTAKEDYLLKLIDCDVCLFFIDNKDGVGEGTLTEIRTAQQNNIKSIYYFCDENSKEITEIEKELIGGNYSKFSHVHKFEDLISISSDQLIEDIFSTYHYYCKGNFTTSIDGQDINNLNKIFDEGINKDYFKQIDCSINYLLKEVFKYNNVLDNNSSQNVLDYFTLSFLKIVLRKGKFEDFDVKGYLNQLKSIQDKEMFEVISLRWNAISSYYKGDLEECCKYLKEASNKAKTNNIPSWLQQEILIDSRNRNIELGLSDNKIYHGQEQQDQLNAINDIYYFPIQDRLNSRLKEKQLNGLYKLSVQSPFTIHIGNDFGEYGNILVSLLMIAMYYGSINSLLLIDNKIKDLVLYFSKQNDYEGYDIEYLKWLLLTGDNKEIKLYLTRHAALREKLSRDKCIELMGLYEYEPIEYKKDQLLFLSFGYLGYYLDDETYQKYETIIFDFINDWLEKENHNVEVGRYFFTSLTQCSVRLNQNKLIEVCTKFIQKGYSRYYLDMFKFLTESIDLEQIDKPKLDDFVNILCVMIDDDNFSLSSNQIEYLLIIIVKKDNSYRKPIEKILKKRYTSFYEDVYKLNLYTDNEEIVRNIQKCINQIHDSNKTQGKNARYSYGMNYHAFLYELLISKDLELDDDLVISIIRTVAETIVESKQSIQNKMDSVLILCFIIHRYPEIYKNNKKIYRRVLKQDYSNYLDEEYGLFTNTNEIALSFALEMLRLNVYKNNTSDIIRTLTNLDSSDEATILSVQKFIRKEFINLVELSPYKSIRQVLLQECYKWLNEEYIDIKCNAVVILTKLSYFSDLNEMISNQLLNIVKQKVPKVNNIILQSLNENQSLSNDIKEEIVNLCKIDNNYTVRYNALKMETF